MRSVYGAITVGRRSTVDACSTVEARTVDGERLVLLVAVQGDLATPTLEVIKGTFGKLAKADASAATKLAAPGLPPQFASGVAVILISGNRIFVGTWGAAGCYRERAGTLEPLAPGAFELSSGDSVFAASHSELTAGLGFLGTVVTSAADDAFHNDGLDDALEAALASHVTLLSLSAAHVR